MLALEAGCDALIVGHDLRRGRRARADRRRARRSGCAEARLRGGGGPGRTQLAEWARPTRRCGRPRGARVPRRAARSQVDGDVSLRPRAARRRAAPGREHRRGRGRARARHGAVVREGEPVPAGRRATSCATRIAIRGCAGRRPSTGCVVVETGLPVWRPGRARGVRRDARRRPRVARRSGGAARRDARTSSASCASSRRRSRGCSSGSSATRSGSARSSRATTSSTS